LAAALAIRPRNRITALGVAIAVGAHVLILAGLILSIEIPRLAEPPPMRVSLVAPFRLVPPRRPPAPPKPLHRTLVPIAPRLGRVVGPEQTQTLAIPAAPPDAATRERLLAAPFAEHGTVREDLRTTAGCSESDWLKLSPAEQAACRQRARSLGAGAPVYAVGPSDPAHRAFLDKQAAKNEAREQALEAPPTHPMSLCEGRMSNLGFSCPP